jgi:hypothetical protein
MKLPENKRERILLIAFVTPSLVAIVYLGRSLFWTPTREAHARNQEKIAQLADKIAKGERELKVAPEFSARFDDSQALFSQMVSNNLLRPILGSYQISLQERLTPVIRATGFNLSAMMPVGNQPFPSHAKTGTFACTMAEITGTGSYETICRLIGAILNVSPSIQITEITIQGQEKSQPQLHRTSIRIEWPIKAKEDEHE